MKRRPCLFTPVQQKASAINFNSSVHASPAHLASLHVCTWEGFSVFRSYVLTSRDCELEILRNFFRKRKMWHCEYLLHHNRTSFFSPPPRPCPNTSFRDCCFFFVFFLTHLERRLRSPSQQTWAVLIYLNEIPKKKTPKIHMSCDVMFPIEMEEESRYSWSSSSLRREKATAWYRGSSSGARLRRSSALALYVRLLTSANKPAVA